MTHQGQSTPLAERALLVAQVRALVESGVPLRRACADLGLNHNNYYRWTRAAEVAAIREPSAPVRRGRRTKFELSHAESRRLRFWRLVKGSVPLAVEAAIAESLADSDDAYFTALRAALGDTGTGEATARLHPQTAADLRDHWRAAVEARRPVAWPLAIQRACRVTAAEEAEFRGKKQSSDLRGMERRGTMIRTEEGETIPWYAGAIWESDDMSLNDPFRFHDAASGVEMLGRQALFTIDAFSLHWLGCTHIGRDRDSYRAEDIASHFRDVVEQHGLPLIWRVERGRWDNNFIWGTKIGTTPEGKEIRWGGLDAIIHMLEKHTSQGKANVEGSFDLLQALMDHGFNGQTLSIGRERGEFESATRHMLRADRDPASLAKFWTITQSAEATARAMHLFNTRPKRRQAFHGEVHVPTQLWATAVKRPCPSDQLWRFHAIKCTARVRRGLVEIKAPHYPLKFRFRIHGGHRTPGLHLDDGHELLVAFTPAAAWEGCHIFNADKSARNRDGFKFGQFLGIAEHMADALQEDLSGAGAHSAGQNRAAAQVRKETRTLIAGTPFAGRRVSHAQDSFGANLTQMRSSTPAATPVTDRSAQVDEPVTDRRAFSPVRISDRQTNPIEDLDLDDETAALSL